MEITALSVSVLVNAILVTVILFGIFELRKTRERLFRKDGYIRQTKSKLQVAHQEIQRKETVILREKGKGNWTTQFFIEEQIDKGFFRNDHIVRYRFQLLLNGFPVGQPGTISEETCRVVDKEQVNRSLQEFAKPLLDAGLNVAFRSIPA
jgi:hypothetical protein